MACHPTAPLTDAQEARVREIVRDMFARENGHAAARPVVLHRVPTVRRRPEA